MTQLLLEVLAATAGTIAFSLLFGVPGKYYLECGLTGGIGWLFYRLLVLFTPLRAVFGLILLPGKLYLAALGLIIVPLVVMELGKLGAFLIRKNKKKVG